MAVSAAAVAEVVDRMATVDAVSVEAAVSAGYGACAGVVGSS